MIRLHLLPWCSRLETLRARHLLDLEAKVGRGEAPVQRDFPHWPEKLSLHLSEHQANKCAYCEDSPGKGDLTVEHFRPKLGEEGYWWLAWSAENLLAVCAGCQSRKGDRFPIEGTRLSIGQHPPGDERPAFLHPGLTDPSSHVELRKVDGRWTIDHMGTREGRHTVAALALADRFLGRFDLHAKAVEDSFDPVRTLLSAGEREGAVVLWGRKLDIYDCDQAIFRALTRAILTELFAAELRVGTLTFRDGAPSTTGIVLSLEEEARKAAIDALAADARDAVYRLGGRAENEEWDTAIWAVLGEGPKSVADLILLFDMNRPTVRKHLTRLESRGEVRQQGDVWSWVGP